MASTASPNANLENLRPSELIEIIRRQSELIEELRKQIEELRRKSHRQANPFSKNKPVAEPKTPGRKRGQGNFTNRPSPPERPTDLRIQTTNPESCPDCGGEVDLERVEEATVTDMPARPEPVVTRYSVAVCRCRKCGKRVRGKAPGLAPDQAGATAHRVGDVAMATAQALHYEVGIPVRKIPAVLQALTGMEVTASAITQDAMKQAAGPVGEAYRNLCGAVREQPVVHTDDTGWSVGGKNAFLMGFESDQVAVFQIRHRHRSQEVREIIPEDFAGVLVTDRGVSYDAKVFEGMRQQKCIGHLLRNISEVLETKTGRSRWFGEELQKMLRETLELSKAPPGEERSGRIEDLELRLNWHLRDRVLKDDDNQRLLNGIGTQMDRDRITTCLHVPGVEATNNRAERLLRPAVIARKVSQCSKNEHGAEAASAYLSVIQTARKALSGTLASRFASVVATLINPSALLTTR